MIGPIPSPLFKYLPHQFADAMIKRGEFLIGTLHGFRRVEELGEEIGDAGEGTKQVVDAADGHWKDIIKRPNLAQTFISAPPDANITMKGITFQVNYDVPDMFVYCVAAVRDDDRMMPEFKADTCVVITNPIRFFRALDAALRARQLVKQFVVAQCHYGDRRREIATDQNLHPALIKPIRSAYQHEIRALWEPRNRPLEQKVLSDREGLGSSSRCSYFNRGAGI